MNSFVGFMVLVELAVYICNTLKVSTHLSFLDFRTAQLLVVPHHKQQFDQASS